MAHALLSPSAASRWMTCPPSARLETKFENTTSVYAEEGLLAHSLADALCKYSVGTLIGEDFATVLGQIGHSQYYNSEMHGYIDAYSQYVAECFATAKARTGDAVIETEVKFDLRKYIPDSFGTSDVVIIGDGIMQVIDLKYGQGVPVDAENNKQMMIYALGALEKYDFLYDIHTVNMTIYQPRLDNISTWDLPVEDLREWAETELKVKAALAYDGAGDYKAGGHCRFCRAKAICRARAEENLRLAQYEFKQGPLLSDEEIGDILKVSENLKNWAENVAAYALEQAISGTQYEGWKLVEGRSNRIISDETAAVETLEALYPPEKIYNKKLKGIGDLEKLMGKKAFNASLGSLIIKP
ncbi:MAG: DUF2800 domain-containing protein, partial [Clostridiales bacterium]|nr:DUF2800 domain-containing protein [Clostridiales bacterium]